MTRTEEFERLRPHLGVTFEPVAVNRGPGLITRGPQGKVASVLSLEVLEV